MIIAGQGGGRKKRSAARRDDRGPPARETNEEFIRRAIENRDYTGAVVFIEFMRDELGEAYSKETALWHAYSLFHLGRYAEAIRVYEGLLRQEPDDQQLHLMIASCYFYDQDFEEAKAAALRGPPGDYRTRLIFHVSHQLNDEQELFAAHAQLVGTLENQLSLAAIHYLRSHHSDAAEIYQRLLQQHPEFLALHVYVAMCYFKMEMYEECNESVDVYLQENSDSAVALNLKSCAYLKLYEADIAESQLLQIKKFSSAAYDFVDNLIAHNLCIFHDGASGFQVLPPLMGCLPEARFNLAVLYLRANNRQDAAELLKDWQPVEVGESVLKATVLLSVGQLNSESAQIEEANAIFQEIGDMESTKDTVLGRQCLATHQFIVGEYDETLRVLQTIQDIVGDRDEYNFNKGMTLASLNKWTEAEKHFMMVRNPSYTREFFYTSWLARCLIKNKKPESAWNLYVDATSTEDSKALLHIIASDCFAGGLYYYAMRAYDVLAKYERDRSFRDGLIASAIGVFRAVLTKKESKDRLRDVQGILSTEPEATEVLRAITEHLAEADL